MTKTTMAGRSFHCSLLSLFFHIVALTWLVLNVQHPREPGRTYSAGEFAKTMSDASRIPSVLDLVGNLTALVGITFAVLATKHRQWGITLVAAWVLNLVGLCAVSGTWAYVG